MAAQSEPEPNMTGDHFNGKLENPCVFNRALTDNELDALLRGVDPAQIGDALVAAWDFGRDFSSAMVTDVSGNDLHGRTANMPARAVTGHKWTGEEVSFGHAPEQYAAIHFHKDDLADACWDVDFTLTIPEGMPSGVYAARLQAGGSEDHVPFFVRPAPEQAECAHPFSRPDPQLPRLRQLPSGGDIGGAGGYGEAGRTSTGLRIIRSSPRISSWSTITC